MTESRSMPAQLCGLDNKSPTPKYLPGQRSLFSEELASEIVSAEVEAVAELFYTGQDLPGAHESDQIILWDVA